MAKILICPNKYVQGSGEMRKIADYAKAYGKKALVVITSSGYKRIGATLEASFGGSEVVAVYDYFNGECSWNEINRLIAVMKANECDMVIGIGGGKILDTDAVSKVYTTDSICHYDGDKIEDAVTWTLSPVEEEGENNFNAKLKKLADGYAL